MKSDREIESRFLWACKNKTLEKDLLRRLSQEGMDFAKPLAPGSYPDGKGLFALKLMEAAAPARLACQAMGGTPRFAETLGALADLGADCSSAIEDLAKAGISARDSEGDEALFAALDVAAKLGARKNGGEDPRDHPLEIAARNSKPALFRKLLEIGSDPKESPAPLKTLLGRSLASQREWDIWAPELKAAFADGLLSLAEPVRKGKRERVGAFLIRVVSLAGGSGTSAEIGALDLLEAGMPNLAPRQAKSLCAEIERRKDWQESFAARALSIVEGEALKKIRGKGKPAKSAKRPGKGL